MMIVQAIDSAPTEHAVFFLVTAYIESLRHFERGCGVPQRAIALPVSGVSDLAERFEILRAGVDVAPESAVATAEAAEVLGTALKRLSVLEQARQNPPAAAMRSARSDTRHSSLSV
jgi:hypothetical protein